MPSSRALPNPGIEPVPPALHADSLLSEPQGKHACTSINDLIYVNYMTFPGDLCRGSSRKQVS